MKQLDDLHEKISNGQIDLDLRNAITDRIVEFIEQNKASLGMWEKFHLGQSISALGTTNSSDDQPLDTWFKLSLLSLEKAMVPEDERGKENEDIDEKVGSVTYEMLVGALNELKAN